MPCWCAVTHIVDVGFSMLTAVQVAFAEELLQAHMVAAAAELQAMAQGGSSSAGQQANGLSRKARLLPPVCSPLCSTCIAATVQLCCKVVQSRKQGT